MVIPPFIIWIIFHLVEKKNGILSKKAVFLMGS